MLATDLQALDGNFVFMDKRKKTPKRKHDLYFPPKMDDFWPLERVWAILAARVYRNPRPTHISGVMRRVRETVRELDATTLKNSFTKCRRKCKKSTD